MDATMSTQRRTRVRHSMIFFIFVVTSINYADRATLEQSRTNATAVREEFAAAMGAQILEVAEFELVLHHLRVPETV